MPQAQTAGELGLTFIILGIRIALLILAIYLIVRIVKAYRMNRRVSQSSVVVAPSTMQSQHRQTQDEQQQEIISGSKPMFCKHCGKPLKQGWELHCKRCGCIQSDSEAISYYCLFCGDELKSAGDRLCVYCGRDQYAHETTEAQVETVSQQQEDENLPEVKTSIWPLVVGLVVVLALSGFLSS